MRKDDTFGGSCGPFTILQDKDMHNQFLCIKMILFISSFMQNYLHKLYFRMRGD